MSTDAQIKMFFDKLSESGILNNTVVVMYGDHTGVHKYYNNEIKDLDKDFDEDLLMKLMYIYTLANRNSNEFNN